MKIRLGYACISKIIDTTSSKTTTLTYYNKLDTNNKSIKIDNIIKENLYNLEQIIKYNIKNNIHFFRMTASLIPLIDIYDIDLNKYKDKFIYIGKLINESNMRVDIHENEYCVLNSVNKEVIIKSIKMLNSLKKVMDMFKINYNIILHIGSKSGGINKSINIFIETFNILDNDLKNKIILENDDKSYNVYQTLRLCEKINVPMCLDIHHHYCNKCTKDINIYMERIFNTYKKCKIKMHYSSPKSKKEKRTHNEYINSDEFINFIAFLKRYDKDIDIMLEAKGKDFALVKLVYELKFKENYHFIDESSFTI